MSEAQSAPKFVVLEKSLIGNRLHEAGDEITLPPGTLPAENLSATCDAGRALKDEYTRSNAERVAKMKAENTESAVGDPFAFAKALSEANAAAQAGITAAVSAGIAQGIGQLIASGALAAPAGKGKGKAAESDPLA